MQLTGALQQLKLFVQRTEVLKRGYLVKLGKLRKNWKKRSFVLTHEALRYFEDDTARVPKGVIKLAEVVSVGSVVWCGVVWCGVVWCGVVLLPRVCLR